MANVSKLLETKGRDVWHITPDATVYSALELMEKKSVGALAVVLNNKLAGILSERDYARKVFLKGRSSKDTQVKDIMTTNIISVSPETPVMRASALMILNKVRRLPVIENGKLLGIISQGDVCLNIFIKSFCINKNWE